MTVQELIEEKLTILDPLHLEVLNESENHNVPSGSESHFKVTIVTPQFDGIRLIERHRQINQILSEQLSGPIHALAIHAYTESDWTKRFGQAPMSPPCAVGEKPSP